jgi:hypothetical protein
MRFSWGADLNKRPGYWAQTLPVFGCATAEPSIVGFVHALHQSSLAHLLRRYRKMTLLARKQEAEFRRQIQALLQQALQQRDRRQQEQIGDQGVAVARGRLEARLDRSLQRCYRSLRDRRLTNHLLRERDARFTFLNRRGLEARHWRAEQAFRPMVVARKVWGGNRTA